MFRKLTKIILMLGMTLIVSSCAMTTQPSTSTMEILNERLSNIEKELKTKPPHVKRKNGNQQGELTKAQKEFIELMMDYLAEKE